MSRPMSQYTSAADMYATTTTQNQNQGQHQGQRGSTYSTSGFGQGVYGDHPQQQQSHEEEEEDEEDWNVYDDFNNARPISSTPSQPTGLHESQSQGYWDRRSQDGLSIHQDQEKTPIPHSQSQSQMPYTDNLNNRQSLLNSSSFGFDVKNGDPRMSMFSQGTQGGDPYSSRNGLPSSPNEINSSSKDMNASGIELITVPALGQEYSEEEMRKMTRPYKRKSKAGNRRKKVRQGAGKFAEGQWRLFGWLTPKVAVFMAFIFFAALGIILYFVIPRVPTIAFLSTNPLLAVPDGSSMEVHHSPSNFSMDMDLQLRGDNTGGWIPSKASSMNVLVYDSNTQKRVGKGSLDHFSFPGRKKTVFKFPVHFEWQSLNSTGDQTFDDFYKACAPIYGQNGPPRPGLNLRVELTMNIDGLIGQKGTSTSFNSLKCPFTLQPDQ